MNISEPFHIYSSSLSLMKSVESTKRQLMTGVYGPVAEHRTAQPSPGEVTLGRCTDGQRWPGPGNLYHCSGDLDAVPGPGCCCCCCWHSLVLPPSSSVGLCLSPAPAPCMLQTSPHSDTRQLVTPKWRLPDQPLL